MKTIEHKVFCDNLDIVSRETISKVVRSFESYDGGEGKRNTIKKRIPKLFTELWFFI